ncbi:MAG: hypothetical protein COX81_00475 [Candidatus Magasanikbacteria bacterium CG_4_10_14_0_2_um_filter_37_12]|uniref:O-antigen ligase-related domain-containing protein n=1 Tax=Candidatus Magasanikbacteria bacterium CG_4_10_14_0_2_um_filter_37_12 TaxID=1974637 RepID=A0A2M7V9P9_9BACT|nr:MAG: hypothetical protein COX81_00475 [Candidatus Magasanikbacteria bacterium CG_4_10_14_0_2_um_filter_37_12]
MTNLEKKLNADRLLKFFLGAFLFFLPWQTIWIYSEPFVNGTKWEYGVLGYFGTEILLWLSVVFFIAWYFKKLRFKLQTSNFSLRPTKDRIFVLSCLVFIFYLFLSNFWAVNNSLAIQQSFRVMEAFLLFFILYLSPLSFDSAIKWFVAGAIIPAVLGVWQFFIQSTFASKFFGLAQHQVWQAGTSIISGSEIGRWLRAYGSFSHPNIFGGYLLIVLAMLFLCLVKKLKLYKVTKYRILLLAIYCLLLTALFFTFSRSAWLAFLLLILAYLFISWKEKNKQSIFIVVSTLLLFVLVTIFFPLVQNRLVEQSLSEARSVSERIEGYGEALTLFKTHPWFGVGAGNYTAQLIFQNSTLSGSAYQPVHNVFLLVLDELGLIGLFLFLLVIYFFTRQESIVIFKNKYLLFFISYLSLIMFDHYLYSSYVGLMLGAILFAMLFRHEFITE